MTTSSGLEGFSYIEDSTLLNVQILILMGFLTRVVGLLALIFCNRDQMGLTPTPKLIRKLVCAPVQGCLRRMTRCCLQPRPPSLLKETLARHEGSKEQLQLNAEVVALLPYGATTTIEMP